MAFLKFNKSELVNLEYSLKRELVSANKLGAYCNTTISTCNTRRYHGLLAVPLDNMNKDKFILLSAVDESIVVGGRQFNLGIHNYGDIYEPKGHKYIVDFDVDPVPHFTYKIGQIWFSKTLLIVPDKQQLLIKYELLDNSQVRKISLKLKPFLAFRRTHDLTCKNGNADTEGRDIPQGVAYKLYSGFPHLHLQTNKVASFKKAPYWYDGITYSNEARRGFDCKEDLLVPGEFSLELKAGESVILSASITEEKPRTLKAKFENALAAIPVIENHHDLLVHNADQLKIYVDDKMEINAGLTWLHTGFLRETVCALPGLTLHADGNTKEFETILDALIERHHERIYRRTTQVEAPLRITDVLQQYIEFGANEKAVWKKYGTTLKEIIESYGPGRREEVTIHPNGLLWAQKYSTALTWMNTYINGAPVNERAGYQVETNAMWYNALCFALDMERKYGPKKDNEFVGKWLPIRDLVEQNFQPTFYNSRYHCLADFVDHNGQNMDVRPNQLYAVSLDYSPLDDEVKSDIMQVITNELLTRRGIRTLSPRNIKYKGVYDGSQSERDFAVHNGCSFPSLLGDYCKVMFDMLGKAFYKRAEYLCEGFFQDISKHGVGTFAELYDGDPPHEPHGAISGAETTAALLRVRYLMDQYKEVK